MLATIRQRHMAGTLSVVGGLLLWELVSRRLDTGEFGTVLRSKGCEECWHVDLRD